MGGDEIKGDEIGVHEMGDDEIFEWTKCQPTKKEVDVFGIDKKIKDEVEMTKWGNTESNGDEWESYFDL